ncbi:MAG TPA: gamma-glutamyltransferase, partial [Verrucomicrobiales bacterium]|nr:gamma-glutamyltransferase [Verrucomicrobiales bacterium]
MTNPWAFRFFGAVLFLSGISHLQAQAPAPGTSEVWKRSALATVHPLATQAGIKAFEAGGNAVDAAIAAAVTLAVVDSHNSGLGGGCFLLIRTPDGTLSAIDGRETAPAGATRDMFVRDGTAVPELSRTGPLACGVPGSLAAWSLALKKWGRLSLAQIVGPAAQLAEAGFPIDAVFADKLAATASTLAQFEGSRAVFLKSDASPYQEGELLRQPDLAATLREIAKEGSDAFYKGRIAALTESWMKAHGGLLTASDFAAYEPRERQPILSQYRGCEIVGFPPPSSGGVHVSQI